MRPYSALPTPSPSKSLSRKLSALPILISTFRSQGKNEPREGPRISSKEQQEARASADTLNRFYEEGAKETLRKNIG
jgi:hypothetical protein